MAIDRVETDHQLETIKTLFREYVEFLGVSLDFQEFETELEQLPGKYSLPDGGLFLISYKGKYVGCGAVRRFGDAALHACEMKRLYIRPEARGTGLGKVLAEFLVEEGIRLGYRVMYLDTLERLHAAMRMYESMGFKQTKAYYANPLPDVIYWEKDLTSNSL